MSVDTIAFLCPHFFNVLFLQNIDIFRSGSAIVEETHNFIEIHA